MSCMDNVMQECQDVIPSSPSNSGLYTGQLTVSEVVEINYDNTP